MFEVIIPVEPVPKARPRLGRGGRVFTPPKTVKFEKEVASYIRSSVAKMGIQRFEGPVSLTVTFWIKKPKTVKRILPSVKADLDNYLKSLIDACNGILFTDDALVCDIYARKRYTENNPYIDLKCEKLDG